MVESSSAVADAAIASSQSNYPSPVHFDRRAMPTSDSASAIIGGSVTGSHLLHIEGYSRTKLFAGGERVGSQSFSVGGREWRLDYVPNPSDLQIGYSTIYINLMLVLVDSLPDPVCARARFALLDQVGNEVPAFTQSSGWYDYLFSGYQHGVFISKQAMEASPGLVVNDCFKFRCHVHVLKSFRKENRGQSMAAPSVVPPSDLHQHLGDLLVTKEGADVTFQVAGETFGAHKCILAARSPVFKAQFLGAMKESTNAEHCIRIYDMVPQVFDALLHFIYTDSLPEVMTGQEDEVPLAQHLLEAADRYALQRLKMICEQKLCRHLDVNTVANTLVLAEQHCCDRLKLACIQFLKSTQSLQEVMATSGFDHLMESFPALLRELISEVAAR